MKPTPLQILLVAESEGFHARIGEILAPMKERVSLRTAATLAKAREALADRSFDLVLLDLRLPDGPGTDLLLEGCANPPFPAVLLTDQRAESYSRLVFQAGALDYLPKTPAELANLPHVVERSVREWEEVHQCLQAKDELRRKTEKYRLLFENMTEALALDQLICDAEGKPVDWRVLDINPAYEMILQIPRHQAVGRLASDLYSPSLEIAPLLEIYARVALTGDPAQMELYFPNTRRHLLISVFALGEGRFATLSTDITERKMIESERARLLAELEATINAIAEAVIIYRPDGEIERMNPAAERMLGYSEKDREKPLAERIARFRVETPDGQPFPLVETMQRVFAGETLCGTIAILHRPDGSTIWMSNSSAPIRSIDGKLLGAVGVSTDITALRELQEQRDFCLHTVSHDLRTPMTLIQGYAELLQQKVAEEGINGVWVHIVEELLRGAQRMRTMIDDLIETARSEGGQIRLNRSLIRLEDFVADLIRTYARLLEPERLLIDIPGYFPRLYVDPSRMERIFLNLFTNALKYSPPKSPIVLTARATSEMVTIAVSDSGPGIDPEDLPHIFERFYRGRGPQTAGSLGLGLFITRMLVEAHGGWVGVESKPSRGSTFTVTLPRSLVWEKAVICESKPKPEQQGM